MPVFGTTERGAKLRIVFSFMIALTLFLVSLIFYSMLKAELIRRTPAVEWYGVRVDTPTIKPGDILRLTYRVKVNKTCPADIRAALIGPDGSTAVAFPVRLGGYTKPTYGVIEAPITIHIPLFSDSGRPPFRDGDYTYRMLATRYCPEGIQEDAGAQDARFRLVTGND